MSGGQNGSGLDVARSFATYRQIDHWARIGLLPIPNGSPGFGVNRDYSGVLSHVRAAAALSALWESRRKGAIKRAQVDELARTGRLHIALPGGSALVVLDDVVRTAAG